MAIYEYVPCMNGHIFIWAGDNSQPVPEGILCECGQIVAHWEKCLCCNQESLVARPVRLVGTE